MRCPSGCDRDGGGPEDPEPIESGKLREAAVHPIDDLLALGSRDEHREDPLMLYASPPPLPSSAMELASASETLKGMLCVRPLAPKVRVTV